MSKHFNYCSARMREMGSPERRLQPSESSIKRVHLPQDGKATLIFSSWDQLVTGLQQFTSEKWQRIHLPAGDVAIEKKLRREGEGVLPNYSDEEMGFYQTFYETPPTTAKHVEMVLNKIKTSTDYGNTYTTEDKVLNYGRVFYGSRVQVDPLVRDETPFYKVAVGSEFLGNRVEGALEASGAERATQPKFVSIEYAQKDGKFSIDLDDVSERLRTTLDNDIPQLSGNNLAYRLHSIDNVKESVIDLGNYKGLSLGIHCRHEIGFIREGNVVRGRIPNPVEGGWMPATLDISIASSELRKSIGAAVVSNDIILPDQRLAAQNLAERIADAFRP